MHNIKTKPKISPQIFLKRKIENKLLTMAFLWRRRSSLVKIVVLLSAVWFTVAFLIYSEDRRSNGQAAQNLPLALKQEFRDFNEFNNIDNNEINDDDANVQNVNADPNGMGVGGDRMDGGKFGGAIDFPDEPGVAGEMHKPQQQHHHTEKKTKKPSAKSKIAAKEEDSE